MGKKIGLGDKNLSTNKFLTLLQFRYRLNFTANSSSFTKKNGTTNVANDTMARVIM